MKSIRCAVCVIVPAALVSAAAADPTNFRDWIDDNGYASNSTSNLWYGTSGVNGPLMTPVSSGWSTPSGQHSTPSITGPINPGDNNGAAGPATFPGMFAHPGAGVPVVLVFAPQAPTYIAGITVHSELVTNGLTGNGVLISATSEINSTLTSLGQTTLAATADDRTDFFPLATPTLFQPGDKLHVVISDRGSFVYDHVNFNAWLDVPSPGSAALLGMAGCLTAARRRKH